MNFIIFSEDNVRFLFCSRVKTEKEPLHTVIAFYFSKCFFDVSFLGILPQGIKQGGFVQHFLLNYLPHVQQ